MVSSMPKGKMIGIIPAILTPIDKENKVDLEALKNLVRFLVEKGVHGLYPCGTTGEGPLLSLDERKKVAEIVVDEAKASVRVMVHTGSINFNDVIALSKHAEDIGADAVGVVTPFYYKYDDEAMFKFYSDIASSVDLSLYLYNIPPLTGNWISVKVIDRLVSEHSNIVGIKDTSGDIKYILAILREVGDRIDVISGAESILLTSLLAGAVGGISGLANAFPETVVGIYNEYKNGNINKAWELQFKLDGLSKLIDSTNFISYLKGVLVARGVNIGLHVKKPLRPLTNEEFEKLKSQLTKYNL